MSGEQTLSELERNLAIALHNGEQDKCVAALRQSEFVLPITDAMHEGREPVVWPTITTPDGRVAIIAFTSVALMQEVSGGRATYGQRTSMAHLCSGWPDNTWILSINPGTPLQFEFESGYVGRLACPDLDMQRYATPDLPIPIVQKPLRIDETAAVLTDTANRISGYVQKSMDTTRFQTPDAMLNACGIYDHAPYLTEQGSLRLLRWYAVGNELYRVPFGGRDEQQRAATAGWVIEPAPFVGLGMAPHPNSIVAEYKVNGIVLPDAAEIGELRPDGDYRRVAVFSGDADRWLAIVRASDLDEVPAGLHVEWVAQRDELLQLIEDDS
mgnify:CR=1 FL=1